MRVLLNVLGGLLIFSGLFWALQGAGVIMWPAESFMLGERPWVMNGLLTAAAGALLIWLARRLRR